MTCCLVAVTGAFAVFGTLEASADAKPALSRQQAVQAAGNKLDSRAARVGDVLSFGIDRCVRRGRLAFACRATLVRDSGSGTVDCGLTYRVEQRRAKIKTTLTRNRCEVGPGDHDSGGNDDGPGFWIVEPRDPNNPFQGGPGPKYCPGYKGAENWDATPDIVGKTYAEAIPIAAGHGCQVRIVRIDGEYQVVTMDLRYERLNVEVEGPDQLIMAINSVG